MCNLASEIDSIIIVGLLTLRCVMAYRPRPILVLDEHSCNNHAIHMFFRALHVHIKAPHHDHTPV